MARRSDKEVFLAALERVGGSAGNTALLRELGWTDDKYWKIHQKLYEEGLIEKGRGYGGKVLLAQRDAAPATKEDTEALASALAATSPEVAKTLVEAYTNELQLYPSVKEQIETHWARRRQLDDCHCEITALQGRRDTGGSWSRPDLALVAYRKYEFLPERVFELISFEVKPTNDISIKGVMEALAHREAATRSYVIYHTAGQDFSSFPEAERIEEVASRHGVGVYAAKDVNDFNQWAEVVTAIRANPDPEAVDTFIRRTLSDQAKTKLRKWF
ncbi:hypothetical protein CN311_08855 [Mesorhizobium sanjuanii]|uniref:Uncharacterized protein n=1 Tax=Mesorhizobium sanjuanii TaxID=2037900 RepID=A0A2A6FHW5_9HYPH|nr:hypothetical protein [Mesorhizobium sanjuanii]PDQ21424.1 hypothetical protein CN311_08855 [Mesorhizobium sanjuanii]